MRSLRLLSAVAPIALLICLAGCAQLDGLFAGGTPTPTVDPRPTAPGDAVPDGTNLQHGQFAYELPDGSTVLVVKDEPLPDAVTADLNTRIATIPVASDNDVTVRADGSSEKGGANKAIDTAVNNVAESVQRDTGHRALIIAQYFTAIWPDETWARRYVIESPPGFTVSDDSLHIQNYGNGLDRSATVAYAQQWIASQPDSANWVLLVQAGN